MPKPPKDTLGLNGVVDNSEQLTDKERLELAGYEQEIAAGRCAMETGFLRMVRAMYQIHERRLYRQLHGTFAEYFRSRWHYSRAHSYRLVEAGRLLDALKEAPQIALLERFTTPGHFRPLERLRDDEERRTALEIAAKWEQWTPAAPISPAVVEAAVSVASSFTRTPTTGTSQREILVGKVEGLIGDMRSALPPKTPVEVLKAVDGLSKRVRKLARRRDTGISWTETTWNPLQGCSYASEGCRHCYAAKLVATRLKQRFPGLAREKMEKDDKGKDYKGYLFTGKIKLLPESLDKPLRDLQPKTYFVNSMSDLFHKKVPTEFVEAVFGVMERASWHVFQVLTKRPGRMADFTETYFKGRTPPRNIWLGTSTEDQDAFEERLQDILRVKTAVRWLSCEPLIDRLDLRLSGIHWVVVGGESGSNRRMKKAWATSIREKCKSAKVPFFFKQWGAFDEAGNKRKGRGGKDGGGKKHKTETLDGKEEEAYPSQRDEVLGQIWTAATPHSSKTEAVAVPLPANVIRITSVAEKHGWLGNMSPHPVEYRGIKYRTTEALFQCLRFDGNPEIQEVIREKKSPMAAKMAAKALRSKITKEICDSTDLERMLLCLRLKIEQHPELVAKLIATGERSIVEDCGRRTDVEIDGKRHGKDGFPFWGARWDGNSWKGQNELGKLWMRIRFELNPKTK